MEIRPATTHDLTRLLDLDGTIESSEYVHVDRAGEGLALSMTMQERPLREKIVDPNTVSDEHRFTLKQVLDGIEEGIALAAEHDDQLVGLLVAQRELDRNTLRLLELRIDCDFRRQGLGTAMLYQAIARARELELRAVTARTLTNNIPAARFMAKAGFDLCGIDTHFFSNHDLVKETVAMFWYAALD